MRLLCIDRFVGKCRSIDTQNYDQLVVKQQHNDVIIKIRETAYEQNDIKDLNISLNFSVCTDFAFFLHQEYCN